MTSIPLEFPQARGTRLRTDDAVTLCRDCRFYKLRLTDRLFGTPELARCDHEMAGTTDSVTGKRSQKHCSTMRIMRCGVEASLFEPRESEQTVKCMVCGDRYEDGETPDGCEDPDCGMHK